ncbi:hypothetical protein A2U01_0053768, partial [Trifolium medium]|nr:hypothetical protein [Trifolium medium]
HLMAINAIKGLDPELSVGAPAGTQPRSTSPGSERSNAGRGHSSDQGTITNEFG